MASFEEKFYELQKEHEQLKSSLRRLEDFNKTGARKEAWGWDFYQELMDKSMNDPDSVKVMIKQKKFGINDNIF